MCRKFEHKVIEVVEGSIAEEMGIEIGDKLININNTVVKDILDYYFLIEDEYLEVLIRKPNNEEWLLEIEKDMGEDLGLKFEGNLLGKYKSCRNKCIFCFIDQLPKGLRKTLYFKDDDSRLSFLKGNYITLTNMTDEDVDRIINYHMSPINISVHTTNPELRKKMLNNKNAGCILKYIDKLSKANIQINGQIVLCKNVNDKDELERTISDLSKFIPQVQSVSIVPVGISKFRDGLYSLQPFNKEDASNIIQHVERWQNKLYKQHKTHFIHASDEFYILADKDLPDESSYDGYLQFGNGVGMMRLFVNEFNQEYAKYKYNDNITKEVSLATALLPLKYIQKMINKINIKFPKIKINIYPIINHFFGENITVSGLLTGTDIISQLKDKKLGDKLLLPCNLLKADEEILLDDVSIQDIEKALHIKIHVVKSSGKSLIDAILK